MSGTWHSITGKCKITRFTRWITQIQWLVGRQVSQTSRKWPGAGIDFSLSNRRVVSHQTSGRTGHWYQEMWRWWRRVLTAGPAFFFFLGVHSSVVSTLHVSSRKPTSSDAVDCEQRRLVVNGLSQSDRRKKDFVRGWWIISAIMNSWKASKGIWFE